MLTALQARRNALSNLSRRPPQQPAKAPPVPCLPSRGLAHHRDVRRVGDFRETATCRHCGDVQAFDRSGDLTVWDTMGRRGDDDDGEDAAWQ